MRSCPECAEGMWLTEIRTPVFPAPLDGGPLMVLEEGYFCPNEQCPRYRDVVPA